MNCLILDDDKSIADFIKSLLEKFYPQIENIIVTDSPTEASKLIYKLSFDILLFDIELQNGETSFDYLDTFPKNDSKLIFITGHPEYAINAIKKRAFDYILKPINITEFKSAISRAIESIQHTEKELVTENLQNKQLNVLTINELDQIRLIPLNDIEYFEAKGPYTILHLKDQTTIISSKHLKHYEEITENVGFFRVHNSYLANTLLIKQIHKKDGVSIEMQSGATVYVSLRKKEEFIAFINNNLSV